MNCDGGYGDECDGDEEEEHQNPLIEDMNGNAQTCDSNICD